MTRQEILDKIKEYATEKGYGVTKYAERIAEAKRRMNGSWVVCPCHRDGEHFCGSSLCQKEIEEKGICGCSLYVKEQENEI